MRVYGFKAYELLSEDKPNLDINFDPKTNWALNNIHLFPVEINKAPYEMLNTSSWNRHYVVLEK